jgi:F0F1-type ATP synthase assembly protein I
MANGRLSPATAEALGLAWGFGWRVVAGVLLGGFLDSWLETEPVFLGIFTIAAFVSGIYDFLRVSQRRIKERKARQGADDDPS